MNAELNFISLIDKCSTLADRIAEFAGDHMEKDPTSISWQDVGDANRLLEMLTEIASTFNLNEPLVIDFDPEA